MRMIVDDAMDVHISVRLIDRARDHTYCHNYAAVNKAWEQRHLSVGHVIRTTLSKTHP